MAVSVFFGPGLPAWARAGQGPLKTAAGLGLGRFGRRPVNLVIVGGAAIRSLNRRFLGKDRLTDVIAFNLPPAPVPGAPWGEIYVCAPVAARQARAIGHSPMTELLILTVHGALHLAGMDDSTPALRRRMNERTASLLRKL